MKTILILSGGLDSTVLLLSLLQKGQEVLALTINYGQRHSREIQAATEICRRLNVPHHVADLTSLRKLLGGSSQTDPNIPVPHGHYAEENMKQTVVPNRNMIMLSIAGAWAISTKADQIAYAAHGGDHAIYPDCRETFVRPLAEALINADWHPVRIERPFLEMSKADIAKLGAHIDPSLSILGLTYSCYEGGEQHCGLCGTCQERRVAFRDAGVQDPTCYDPAGLAKLPDAQLVS